jgi:transcription antitermination protein NusB
VTDAIDPRLLPPDLDLADGDVVEIEDLEDLEVLEVIDDLAGEGAAGDVGLPEVASEPGGPSTPERRSGFDGVGTRREARERALALLYEAEQKAISPLAGVLDALPIPVAAYAGELVVGVSDHLAEIDDLLDRFAVGWTVVRMPAIDRSLLRLASFELGYTEVPVGVCISEAVELAKRYSTDDSPGFVNGLLSRLATELRSEG